MKKSTVSSSQKNAKNTGDGKTNKKPGSDKIKLLRVYQILQECSSDDKPLTRDEIADKLSNEGIKFERRTFGADMKLLAGWKGVGIKEKKIGRKNAYYVQRRALDDTELKILIDAVQEAAFLSKYSTEHIVKKLGSIGGPTIKKRVDESYKLMRIKKRSNEEILDSIEAIRNALVDGRRISFVYNDRNINKELVPRNEGQRYTAEPLTLIIDNGRYYVMCYDKEGNDNIKKYRLDRMTEVIEEKKKVSDVALEKRDDLPVHISTLFSMYGGPAKSIALRFKKELAEMIFDAFGEDVECREADDDPNAATVTVKVSLSPTFFSWITNFRGDIIIEGPLDVRDEYEKFLKANRKPYGK
ncbi:WYL domain-containing protein [bacterium]|nr:WYL domain-containing protein [bacterium]